MSDGPSSDDGRPPDEGTPAGDDPADGGPSTPDENGAAARDGPDDDGTPPRNPREGDPDRRNLLRWIIVAAIGIPVLIELRTFLALVGVIEGGGGTATPTPTPDVERVGEGDELLPATGPTETVADAVVMARDEGDWLFRLVVAVDNDDDGEYQLRLGAVTTESGDVVDGGASTDTLAPGESARLTAEWAIPPGAAPETLQVSGVTYEDGSATGQTSETVHLADVPVQGS
jgi:hypothetical protein